MSIDDGEAPPAKRHRITEAPTKWSELPAERLRFCIGNQAANTAVGLINSAARCPALTAYDLRWRRHAGQSPDIVAPDVELRNQLLDNNNDPPVPVWPGLKIELTEQQRKSLHWMLSKEVGTDDELVVERGCHDCRFSTHRGIDFQVRLSFTLRGGILADAMGYGKTLLAIATIAASFQTPLPSLKGRMPCGATLIFVPENLVRQWLSEFEKMLGDVVDVKLLGHADNAEAPQQQFGQAVAETTQQYQSSCSGLETTGHGCRASIIDSEDGMRKKVRVYAATSVKGWEQLMQEQWPEAIALVIPYSLLRDVEPWFCLHRYHWRRVIVDELHESLRCQTIADALGIVSAQHVWGLSGTLPTATTGDVARLAALFGVSMPIDTTNAGRFLDCYVRRNSGTITSSIPMDEHWEVVRPSPMERAIYLACQHDFDELAMHEGYVPAFLSTWRGLQEHGREAALVKLCCHHQVTSADVEILSTPERSVERLCVWKQHHCQEARRLMRQHTLLAEWMCRNSGTAEAQSDGSPAVVLPKEPKKKGTCEVEAWDLARVELSEAANLSNEDLLAACSKDLEATPFAVCDRPLEAQTRWLEWCELTGLAPGSRGAISRLRKIMYDELWGRFVDGIEGWSALSGMPGRDWRADYAAAQVSRLVEVINDYSSSLRSIRFLQHAVSQARSKELDCGICLQIMWAPRITPCAHLFCSSCIERSLKNKAECPQCRAPIRGIAALSSLGGPVGTSGNTSANAGDAAPQAQRQETQAGKRLPAAQDRGVAYEGDFGSKITALVGRLKEICSKGEKAVVFAQWQDLIFKIHVALIKFGVPGAVLAGGAFDRASVLQRFESPDLPVLLLSLEDSASGTNMAHANHVLLVHPMVAASAEEQRAYEAQAIGRVRRWGQCRRVQVWRYVMEGTIEADLAAQCSASTAESPAIPTDSSQA